MTKTMLINESLGNYNFLKQEVKLFFFFQTLNVDVFKNDVINVTVTK